MCFRFTDKELFDSEYLAVRALRDPDSLRLLETIDELIHVVGPQWRRRAQRRSGLYSQVKVCITALEETRKYGSYVEHKNRNACLYEAFPEIFGVESATEEERLSASQRLYRPGASMASCIPPQDRAEKQLLAT